MSRDSKFQVGTDFKLGGHVPACQCLRQGHESEPGLGNRDRDIPSRAGMVDNRAGGLRLGLGP
jgi:hypothetical protein